MKRFVKRHPIANIFYHVLGHYPVPSSVNYFWNFGFLAGICLVIQIVTGVGLAMHYCPDANQAFLSLEHIMRDVNYGWLLRYGHANGASVFFIVVYTHMLRGIYYGSYMRPRQAVWVSGLVIFLLMMATGFLGYVLPWGQMSFWGVTVITNLFGAIPYIGTDIVYWLWGGFSVDNPTLNKFYSLHYLLPFAILAVVIMHLLLLHEVGSSNPLGTSSKTDVMPFTPYSVYKDLYTMLGLFIMTGIFVCFQPNYLGHPDNYILANPMVTPPHIVPEWYFLPFYAVLRAVPDKLTGVILMASAIATLVLLPFYSFSANRSMLFKPIQRFFFWIFVGDAVLLGWIGGKPVEFPYYEVGQACTIAYFSYFLLIVPILNVFEKYCWVKPTDSLVYNFKPENQDERVEKFLDYAEEKYELVSEKLSVIFYGPQKHYYLVKYPFQPAFYVEDTGKKARDKKYNLNNKKEKNLS